MQNAIDITLHLPIRIIQKEQWYVASCSMLDVHSQGDTAEQAQTNLFEALTLFLASCFERGTLEAVLKEKGSHRSYSKPGCLRPIIIPAYKEVDDDIIHANMRTAKMSRDDYFKYLVQCS